MDFWNRKKVRKLESKIKWIDKDNDRLRKELDELKKKLRGERVCDGYCKTCIHGIEQGQFYPGGFYTAYTCELDCKCKDFQKKDAEAE